jgi:hypothetical protein
MKATGYFIAGLGLLWSGMAIPFAWLAVSRGEYFEFIMLAAISFFTARTALGVFKITRKL